MNTGQASINQAAEVESKLINGELNLRSFKAVGYQEVADWAWLIEHENEIISFFYFCEAVGDEGLFCHFPLLSEVGQNYQAPFEGFLQERATVVEEIDQSPWLITRYAWFNESQ